MRRRKGQRCSDDSEGSDAPEEGEEFQDSGEDWTPDAAAPNAGPGRGGGRKRSAPKPVVNNARKKKAKKTSESYAMDPFTSSEESEPEEKEGENEVEDDEEVSEEEINGSDGNKSDSSQSKDVPKYYHSGNFVLLKSDVKWDGDSVVSKLEDLFLWKIDGKALLQKYIPLVTDGRTVHKCTCVYSGWNVDNRENYYPISEILDRSPKTDVKEPCVALNLTDLIKVRDKR